MDIDHLKYLIEYTLLDKRLEIARAEREVSQFGQWNYDHDKVIEDIDCEFLKLCEKLVIEKSKNQSLTTDEADPTDG